MTARVLDVVESRMMAGFVLLFVFVCMMLISPVGESIGQLIPVVVPRDLAEEEGNMGAVNFTDPFRAVGIWYADDFPDLPETHRLMTGLALRPDASVDDIYHSTWEEVIWRLSTTDEEELSETLSENLDPDDTQTVYEGALRFTTSSGPPDGPRAFEYRVDFQNHFEYHPSDGRNLVWEIVSPSGYSPALLDDGHDFGDGIVRTLLTLDTEGDHAQFISNASLIAEFTFAPFDPIGDFDANGALDIADIDALSRAVRTPPGDPRFDLNSDHKVDTEDQRVWVEDLAQTWFGDANLDGEFNTADLVTVFTANHFEDDIPLNSGWAAGDWNADAEFDTGDLVSAFQDGGYEQGPRVAMRAVPEPSSVLMLIVGWIGIANRRRQIVSCADRQAID